MADQNVFQLEVVVDVAETVESAQPLNLFAKQSQLAWYGPYQLNSDLEARRCTVAAVGTLFHQTTQIGTKRLIGDENFSHMLCNLR